MEKIADSSKFLVLVLSMFAISINAQAVGGSCFGSLCGALASKGSDSARQHSLKKLREKAEMLEQTQPKNIDALGTKALEAHRKVVGEWVAKKYPDVKPGSVMHSNLTIYEMGKDIDREFPIEAPEVSENSRSQ